MAAESSDGAFTAPFFIHVIGSSLGSSYVIWAAIERMRVAGLVMANCLFSGAAVEDVLDKAHEAAWTAGEPWACSLEAASLHASHGRAWGGGQKLGAPRLWNW